MAMLSYHLLPETQAALALSIFFASFIYEDGRPCWRRPVRRRAPGPADGLLAAFLGIGVGDIGLYGLGSSFGRRTAQSRWLQKYLGPESLARPKGGLPGMDGWPWW